MAKKRNNDLPDVAFNDPEPLAMPQELDAERLGRLLRKIEGSEGWDQDFAGLSLYLLYDASYPEIDDFFAKRRETCDAGSRLMCRPPRLGE